MDAGTRKGLLIGCGIPTLMFSGLMLIIAMPNIAGWLSPDPPRPKITYGEFPFRIEYEINGELVIVEDTKICEFDGFVLIGSNKLRRWKSHLASGNGESNYLLIQNAGDKMIYCNIGSVQYYMGDSAEYTMYGPPSFAYKKPGDIIFKTISPTELFNTYGIRLISWEFSDPIANNFY